MKSIMVRASLMAATVWLPIASNLWAEDGAGTGQPPATVQNQASALAGSVALPVLSAYVWRGIVITDRLVAQPNATLSKNGFSLNTWANYNFTDAYSEESQQEISEVDLTLSYSRAVGPVILGASYAEYLYPHQTLVGANGVGEALPGSREIQASIGLPGVPLSPTLTIVRDIDEVDGFYASLACSRSFSLTDKAALALGFSTGVGDKDYNAAYFGTDTAKLNDGNVSVSLPITITSSVTLTPQVQYTWLWDSEIRKQADALYKDDSSVWGGVTLNVTL